MLFNIILALLDIGALWFLQARKQVVLIPFILLIWSGCVFILAFNLTTDMFQVMSYIAWALFIHAPATGMLLALFRFRTHKSQAWWIAGLASVVFLIGAYSYLVEPTWLEISRHEITSEKLTEPLKIALLSDIQTDRVGQYETSVMQLVQDERPDLIILTGDYIQAPWAQRDIEEERLRRLFHRVNLNANQGIFAVQGNTDPPGAGRIFDGLDAVYASKTGTFAGERVDITALSLDDSFDTELTIRERDRFHIAFGHGPDFALGNIEADLLLAGHTHGGQVKLPFFGPPITLSEVPRSWGGGGLVALPDGRHLVVSRGIGMERGSAPPLRFLCRPEVVFITVVPAQ